MPSTSHPSQPQHSSAGHSTSHTLSCTSATTHVKGRHLQRARVARALREKQISSITMILRKWLEYTAAQDQIRSVVFRLHCAKEKRISRMILRGAWNLWMQRCVCRRISQNHKTVIQAHQNAAKSTCIHVRQQFAAATNTCIQY